jgi:hypothetical protein
MPERASTKSLMEKLGVARGARVSVLRAGGPSFVAELEALGADVSIRARKESNLIFAGAERLEDLSRLRSLEPSIRRDGAIWVVFPKGRKEIKEVDVIHAGIDAGLVDNKVVRFSETHTALRFVVPRARR